MAHAPPHRRPRVLSRFAPPSPTQAAGACEALRRTATPRENYKFYHIFQSINALFSVSVNIGPAPIRKRYDSMTAFSDP
jgi:hypothetical protein